MEYAIVKAGKVINVIELKDGAKYKLPTGQTLIKADAKTEIDGTYANDKFTKVVRAVDPQVAIDAQNDALWDRASDYYFKNKTHEFPAYIPLEVCIESDTKHRMTEHCYALLKAQYSN